MVTRKAPAAAGVAPTGLLALKVTDAELTAVTIHASPVVATTAAPTQMPVVHETVKVARSAPSTPDMDITAAQVPSVGKEPAGTVVQTVLPAFRE